MFQLWPPGFSIPVDDELTSTDGQPRIGKWIDFNLCEFIINVDLLVPFIDWCWPSFKVPSKI